VHTDTDEQCVTGDVRTVERVQEHAVTAEANSPAVRLDETEPALELLVHGVGGTTPEEMLGDPRTVRITGDDTAAVFRRAADVDAESRPADQRTGPIREAYVWCNLTSGNGTRALWLLLLPFMVVNLAHWMRPTARDRKRTVRFYGLLVRLAGLTLTVLLVAAACEVALDLAAWQCAGTRACAERHTWLGFLSPTMSHDSWWSRPGRRLALAALVPTALTVLLWYLSRRTWSEYESQQPMNRRPEPDDETGHSSLGRPGFWYGRRLVARLRAAHTAAGLLTVAAAVTVSAARFDRGPDGSDPLAGLGALLETALAGLAFVVVYVVCRRGRSENRLDQALDRRLVRRLPLGALLLLGPRPALRRLVAPGVAVVRAAPGRHRLRRNRPGPGPVGDRPRRRRPPPAPHPSRSARRDARPRRTGRRDAGLRPGRRDVRRGLAAGLRLAGRHRHVHRGPARPAHLAGLGDPALLVVVLVLCAGLGHRTWRLRRSELAAVAHDYPGGGRTGRAPPGSRARARWPYSPTAAPSSSPSSPPRPCSWVPERSSAPSPPTGHRSGPERRTHAFVHGAAQTSQGLGSWLIGLGFILFVTWGRRAYKDASARRTIGILWDVGTFWPRAAHPFAPPCYAERAVPDLTWRMATWTRATGGRLVISGHSQGSVLAAAAAWQLKPAQRKRVALLTYGSPLERLYGRWFPAHFGPAALSRLHREVDCWRNLYRLTDPIGGPVRVSGDCGPEVDHEPLKDPLEYGRTAQHPLPAPILGHSDYQADPAFAEERERLLARLRPEVPPQGSSGRSSA
jgi:hypothetical protein